MVQLHHGIIYKMYHSIPWYFFIRDREKGVIDGLAMWAINRIKSESVIVIVESSKRKRVVLFTA